MNVKTINELRAEQGLPPIEPVPRWGPVDFDGPVTREPRPQAVCPLCASPRGFCVCPPGERRRMAAAMVAKAQRLSKLGDAAAAVAEARAQVAEATREIQDARRRMAMAKPERLPLPPVVDKIVRVMAPPMEPLLRIEQWMLEKACAVPAEKAPSAPVAPPKPVDPSTSPPDELEALQAEAGVLRRELRALRRRAWLACQWPWVPILGAWSWALAKLLG